MIQCETQYVCNHHVCTGHSWCLSSYWFTNLRLFRNLSLFIHSCSCFLNNGVRMCLKPWGGGMPARSFFDMFLAATCCLLWPYLCVCVCVSSLFFPLSSLSRFLSVSTLFSLAFFVSLSLSLLLSIFFIPYSLSLSLSLSLSFSLFPSVLPGDDRQFPACSH